MTSFYSKNYFDIIYEVIKVNLNAYKRILNRRPFMKKVYGVDEFPFNLCAFSLVVDRDLLKDTHR